MTKPLTRNCTFCHAPVTPVGSRVELGLAGVQHLSCHDQEIAAVAFQRGRESVETERQEREAGEAKTRAVRALGEWERSPRCTGCGKHMLASRPDGLPAAHESVAPAPSTPVVCVLCLRAEVNARSAARGAMPAALTPPVPAATSPKPAETPKADTDRFKLIEMD